MKQAEFENIASRLRRKAVSTAVAVLSDCDGAEDIAQEVMLKLWTLRDELNGEAHAERLAACMAKNMSIDRTRKLRTVGLDAGWKLIDEKLVAPDTALEELEDMKWLERRLAGLPSAEYKILRLRQVEMKTADEIARMLGIGKSSVATILSRARRKILDDIRKRQR